MGSGGGFARFYLDTKVAWILGIGDWLDILRGVTSKHGRKLEDLSHSDNNCSRLRAV